MKTSWISIAGAVLLGLTVATPQLHAEIYNEDAEEAVARVAPGLKRDLAKQNLEYGAPIFVRILKQERRLELWVQNADQRYQHFRNYQICKMSGTLGPKQREGDDQAPEGFYSTDADWMWPYSDFHLAFNIRYPNAYDESLKRTGSAIMVHGGCSSSGCFAMTDDKIEEIYAMAGAALTSGQNTIHVHVFPFEMSDKNLARHATSRWAGFWANLKQGYDYFETYRSLPEVQVADGSYVFSDPQPAEPTLAEADANVIGIQAATLPLPEDVPGSVQIK